jgi:hypothetical protein
MPTSSEGVTGKPMESGGKPAGIAGRLWPRVVELWIFAAIVIFLVIRVLGSHSAQRLLSGFGRQHTP